jgi:CRISPR-associated endonuclease Csn1
MRTLGLDLGTNSIGWAFVDRPENTGEIIAAGSRVFIEAVDAKTRAPKNLARRTARMMRRQVARKRQRRIKLLNLLQRVDLLPTDAGQLHSLLHNDDIQNPYTLRARGLDQKLTLWELGRVLYHINRRRGFKSNRKAQFGELINDPEIRTLIEKEESTGKRNVATEESEYLGEIRHLRERIGQEKFRTLGEFLASRDKKRVVFRADRQMYEEEFERLWSKQSEYHSETLTDGLKAEIYRIIFFQRPLKKQKFLVGKCSLEPSKKRAPTAALISQHFRILQEVNNLTVRDPLTHGARSLTPPERQTLVTSLFAHKERRWAAIRRFLGLHSGELFNLEIGGRDSLSGASTSISLRKILGAKWDNLSEDEQSGLVTDLLTIDRMDSLVRRLRDVWKFSPSECYSLATLELETGYQSLSCRAMRKILPYLQQGLQYRAAAEAAGYLFEVRQEKNRHEVLPEPPNVRNPVVQKSLFEVRKVVNAIIRAYGKPDIIRVELARDMKMTKRERLQYSKQLKANEKANKEAAEHARACGIQPAFEDLLKYRLWKELGERCAYSGASIGMNTLFSAAVEIDHIIPYSMCLDDSFMNKTICLASENRLKGQRTPIQAFGTDPIKWPAILAQLSHCPEMSHVKKRKFELNEVKIEDFINRQLSDTRYLSVAAKNYLACLGIPVELTKGEVTSVLRSRWGLNRILSNSKGDSKNRSDHRHHAIDAIVIALTDRNFFYKLSQLSAKYECSLHEHRLVLPEPFPDFYAKVAGCISAVVVSHSLKRKLCDALHEASVFGLDRGRNVLLLRKPLIKLSSNAIEKIRDERVRTLVRARVEAHAGDLKAAFSTPLFHVDGKTPIQSVRLFENFDPDAVVEISNDMKRNRAIFKFGNNHHVEIIENVKTGKRTGRFVTTFEAARRARRAKQPIIDISVSADERFVMSLAINDTILVDSGGDKMFLRVKKLEGTNNNIVLEPVELSSDGKKGSIINKSPNTLRGEKVVVDPIGSIFASHD